MTTDFLQSFALVVCRAERNQQCNRLRDVFSPSRDAVIRVFDVAGNVMETARMMDSVGCSQ